MAHPQGVAPNLEEVCGNANLLLAKHLLPYLLNFLLQRAAGGLVLLLSSGAGRGLPVGGVLLVRL